MQYFKCVGGFTKSSYLVIIRFSTIYLLFAICSLFTRILIFSNRLKDNGRFPFLYFVLKFLLDVELNGSFPFCPTAKSGLNLIIITIY